ncbi:NACHT domain-containing protein [Plantactinospora sp. B5E13]|uniref:NACHT domain-containing protein n=1 Tax=Plantactinospora sp. B5E13 TaxID=3153758 RepID=UPI00325F6800
MPLFETAATGLARTVATHAAQQWLAARRDRADRGRDLSELMELSFRDRLHRRKAELQFESLAADIAGRVERLFAADHAAIPEHESAAALDIVARTFGPDARTDATLFAADADPAALVARLRPALAGHARTVGLSEASARLADRVLVDCVQCYVEVVRHLPEFNSRANQETLARLTRISTDLAEILARLPVSARAAEAPPDDDVTSRYLRFLASEYDQLELFGVDVHNYSPETTLSIAYLSLVVSDPDRRTRTDNRIRKTGPARRGAFFRGAKGESGEEQTGLRVETALARGRRILIRGEAGSGKSTLLRWLTVTAAREGFTGGLRDWNGRIPFLVKLRAYPDGTLPPVGPRLGADIAQFAAEAPTGLVERIFATGRALLLVDGVDELVRSQRAGVRQWLRRLLNRYPDVIVLVTSRPTAAPARWLTGEGFATLTLERMAPADIVEFVRRWHRAIGAGRHLPCEPADLPRYERRLLNRLDANHHLRGLATNPLMCAMLCALNLDRADDLPHDRMSLYGAALAMLLERRDAARDVPAYRRVALGGQAAMSLLQDLAWRLALANQSELEITQAHSHVTRKLATMPKVTAEPDDVFDHLLDRSGVLKDVAEDRISFVHRTFQEYLAAKEIADENYVDILLEHATRDMWRETVVMTAGHASSEYRQRLINGLLDRAGSGPPRRARWLRLLAAACVETAPALALDTLGRIDVCLAQLTPPRSVLEAHSLALAGERVIRHLPDDVAGLTPAAAAAAVATAAFVGGAHALDKLSRYGRDDRPLVVDALIKSASYFEPDEYGRRVLADSPLQNGWVALDGWTAPMARHLRNLHGVRTFTDPAEIVRELPPVKGLRLYHVPEDGEPPVVALDFLGAQPFLEELALYRPVDPAELPATMTRLTDLTLRIAPGYRTADLDWLARFPQLTMLDLGDVGPPSGFDSLTGLTALTGLSLVAPEESVDGLADTRFLCRLPTLTSLYLVNCTDTRVVEWIATSLPHLETLQLMRLRVPALDLDALTGLPLTSLDLDEFEGPLDLTPLAGHATLEHLDLSRCPRLGDLTPLARISGLRRLHLHDVPDLDLAPFAGNRELTVYLNGDQPVRNADGVRLVR